MSSILSESTVSNDEQQEVGIMVRQAYQLLAQNKVQQSIVIYEKCIQQYPRCWRAYQNIGVAYIMLKQFEKANSALKVYVKHVPRDPLGHDSLGVSFSEMNDPLQAICSFVNSINLSPNYYMSYYNLGVVLGKLGLFDYALNVYLYCLQLQPNYINAMNNVADIYKKQGKIDQAIEIFKQIIEMDSSYTLAIKNLGNCYFVKGDYYQALVTYMMIDNVDNYHESVLFNIALCFDHFQQYERAANFAFKAYIKTHAEGNHCLAAHQTFVAATILAKQMRSIYQVLRTYSKMRRTPPQNIVQRFYQCYNQTIGCFRIANQGNLKYEQVQQNIQRTKHNMMGYKAKLAQMHALINKPQLQQSQLKSEINTFLTQQNSLLFEIFKWRKYTKRLVKKIKIQRQAQFQNLKQKFHKVFPKTCYQDLLSYRCITKSYISRRFNHNLKRLIIKRKKYILKYNRLNQKCKQLFRHRKIKITLTQCQPVVPTITL